MFRGVSGSGLKASVKRALHNTGALNVARTSLNRSTLTVVLFHRILPPDDPRAAAADWEFTIRLDKYEKFLSFVQKAFRVVSLKEVEDAYRHGERLPDRALLITFDDAWEDTARYAIPVLERMGLPSVIFVPTDGIGFDLLIWRDVAAMLWRAGRLGADGIANTIAALEHMPGEKRLGLLEAALAEAGDAVRPVMMSTDHYRSLPKSVELAGHGVSHTKFTELADVTHELSGSRAALTALTGSAPHSFAFPYGCYSQQHLRQAHDVGYDLIFTTEVCVNRLSNGRLASPVLGRITITDYDLTGGGDVFSESHLSYSLLDRPYRVLDDSPAGQAARAVGA